MTEDATHICTDFIKSLFGPTTNHNVFITSLANTKDGNEDKPRQLVTRDGADISNFAKRWDRAGCGMFFCVGTLKPGTSRRAKENISEIIGLHADIDMKSLTTDDMSVTIDRDEVLKRLLSLRVKPSAVVDSGGGFHVYYLFNEAYSTGELTFANQGIHCPDVTPRIEAALRLLADTIGGDPAVCEISRLLRLPGTHNTKNGAWREVKVVEISDRRYELDDLEEWLSETSPIIKRKDAPIASFGRFGDSNPFLRLAEQQGYKPSIDVTKRLEQMSYQGAGEFSIHQTQLQCIASLLTRGEDLDATVAYLMNATQTVAGVHGTNWNWGREERALRKMGLDWLKKNPTVKKLEAPSIVPDQEPEGPLPPPGGDNAPDRERPMTGMYAGLTPEQRYNAFNYTGPDTLGPTSLGPTSATVSATATVSNLAEERAKLKAKPATTKPKPVAGGPVAAEPFVIIARGVVDEMRLEGRDIMLAEGEVYIYDGGIWATMTPTEEQWVRTRIQYGFDQLNVAPKPQLLSAAWQHLTQNPDLAKRTVAWAKKDHVVLKNGVLSLKDGSFGAHHPSYYAKRKMGVDYEPGSTCPLFIEFLAGVFGDRHETEKDKVVAMLQEFFGACLVPSALYREQRKALILYGASRTGKTSISHVIRSMIGDGVTAASLKSISGDFGLQPLFGASAWISDDPLQEGTPLDPSVFNCLVTGEPIDVARKNMKTASGYRFDGPIVLTSNALPRVRDQTTAVYNRSLIVECSKEFSELDAAAYQRKLGITPGQTTGEFFVAVEGSGILNWALEGLARLQERGMYDIPDSVRDATETFRNENNQVLEWSRMAVEKAPGSKVSRADLMCSFHGFQKESDGEEARAMGARSFFPRLRSAVPGIDLNVWDHDRRYVGGVSLSKAGMSLWDDHRLGQQLRGSSKGSSTAKDQVNKMWSKEDPRRSANKSHSLDHNQKDTVF